MSALYCHLGCVEGASERATRRGTHPPSTAGATQALETTAIAATEGLQEETSPTGLPVFPQPCTATILLGAAAARDLGSRTTTNVRRRHALEPQKIGPIGLGTARPTRGLTQMREMRDPETPGQTHMPSTQTRRPQVAVRRFCAPTLTAARTVPAPTGRLRKIRPESIRSLSRYPSHSSHDTVSLARSPVASGTPLLGTQRSASTFWLGRPSAQAA